MKRRKPDTSEVARRDSSDGGGISKNLWNKAIVFPLVLGLFFSWFLPKQNQVLAQTASLVATVRINPLEVEVVAPSFVSMDEWFKVKVTVKNLGGTKIEKAKVEIFESSGLSFKGNSERKLGVILAQDSKTASWRVRAEETGNYGISFVVSGIEEGTGDLVEASDSFIVNVRTFTTPLTTPRGWNRFTPQGFSRRFLTRA